MEETPAQRSRALVIGWLALGTVVLVWLIAMYGMISGSKANPARTELVETGP